MSRFGLTEWITKKLLPVYISSSIVDRRTTHYYAMSKFYMTFITPQGTTVRTKGYGNECLSNVCRSAGRPSLCVTLLLYTHDTLRI